MDVVVSPDSSSVKVDEPTELEYLAVRQAEKDVSNARAAAWKEHPGNTMIHFSGSREVKFWRYKFEETEALVEMFSGDNTLRVFDRSKVTNETDCPFLFTTFPSEELLRQVVDRSVTIRGAYHCYHKAQTLQEIIDFVQNEPRSTFEPYVDAKTYRFDITTYASSLSLDQKADIRDPFKIMNFTGELSLTTPEVVFTVFVEYMTKKETPVDCRNAASKMTSEPIAFYFCREIFAPEPYHLAYDLRKRPYIGPTSTDAQLAFLMSNFCRVTPKSYVFDPFVGTGSILIAASHFRALCIGQDLDWKVIHGKMKGKTSNIFDNFRHYNLRAPDLVCSDNSRPAWKLSQPLYDAIISDPPYGIRAGARRLGATEKRREKIEAQWWSQNPNNSGCPNQEPEKYVKPVSQDGVNIPTTKPYPVQDVMYDLLHLAAKQLRVGGRLCYLLPVQLDFKESELPVHPCFSHRYLCEQYLQGEFSRLAVTIEKTAEYDPAVHGSWPEEVRALPLPRWALLHDQVILKASGSIKWNGKVHMTRTEKRKMKEERLLQGLPVSYSFKKQHEIRQQKAQSKQDDLDVEPK